FQMFGCSVYKKCIDTTRANLFRFRFALIAQAEFVRFDAPDVNVTRSWCGLDGLFPKVEQQVIGTFFEWTELPVRRGDLAPLRMRRPVQDETHMTQPLHRRHEFNVKTPCISRDRLHFRYRERSRRPNFRMRRVGEFVFPLPYDHVDLETGHVADVAFNIFL